MPHESRDFDTVLDRLTRDAHLYFGHPLASFRLGAVQDRPYSRLRRVDVEAGGTSFGMFVKIQKVGDRAKLERARKRLEDDFAMTKRVHDELRSDPLAGAVYPIAVFPDLLALVTREVPGSNLLTLIEGAASFMARATERSRLLEALFNVGRWLRVFQGIDQRRGSESSTISLDELTAYVDLRLQRLVNAPRAGFGELDRRAVLNYIAYLRASVDSGELQEVTIHSDLAPANIIVSGTRIVVIDFAMTSRGGRYHDLARLYAQVNLLRHKPHFRPAFIDSLQAALLRGFRADLDASHPLFRLHLLLHTVNHFATLSLKPEAFPARVYNWWVRRHHRRWLQQTVAGAGSPLG